MTQARGYLSPELAIGWQIGKYAADFFSGLEKVGIAVTDDMGRDVSLPDKIERLICSGPGCLRLITYLQGIDKVVAVDGKQTECDSKCSFSRYP